MMDWDHRYRMLNEGETILLSDEVQRDDGSWMSSGPTAGMRAPSPLYSSHRVYRRLKEDPYRTVESALMGRGWTDSEADRLIFLVEAGRIR